MNKSKPSLRSTPKTPENSKMSIKSKIPISTTTPNKSGQLTGSPRVLNDTVITIHSLVQAWKVNLMNGIKPFQILQKLGTLDSNKHEKDRQLACEQIGDILRLMEGLVEKMHVHAEKLISLAVLNKDSPPPFFTWKYSDFMEMATRTVQYFEAETVLRTKMATKLSTVKNEELDFCTIVWLHTIHAGSSFESEFGAMLRELLPPTIQSKS